MEGDWIECVAAVQQKRRKRRGRMKFSESMAFTPIKFVGNEAYQSGLQVSAAMRPIAHETTPCFTYSVWRPLVKVVPS
jgi:hypothetical protein